MNIEERTAARDAAAEEAINNQRRTYRHSDFVYDRTQDKFWCRVTKQLLSKEAVDNSIPRAAWRLQTIMPPEREEGARGRPARPREVAVNPHKDIMAIENNSFVEGATWWPGEGEFIHNRTVTDEGLFATPGVRLFNTFVPSKVVPAPVPPQDCLWAQHVRALFPDPVQHNYFLDYAAHAAQKPYEKGGAGIVLSGTQGIGKDAILEPLKSVIGHHNCKNIDPDEIFSPYQPFRRSVMLVIDEVRPSKEDGRASTFYNSLKPLMAAPPFTLPVNNKFEKVMQIPNVVRVFMTTNDYQTMFIPQEDRRLLLLHSELPQGWHIRDRTADYFTRFFGKYADPEGAGVAELAAWLMARDISAFDPKLPPPKTEARNSVVGNWVQDVPDVVEQCVDALGAPPLFFTGELAQYAFDDRQELVDVLKKPHKANRIFEALGYKLMRHPELRHFQQRQGDKKVKSAYLAYNSAALPAGTDVHGRMKLAEERLALWLAGKVRKHGQEQPPEEGF